jgi:hypothetical protein
MSKRKMGNTNTPDGIDPANPAPRRSSTSRAGTLEAERSGPAAPDTYSGDRVANAERAASEPHQDRLSEADSQVLDDAREINEYMAALLDRNGIDGTEQAPLYDPPSRREEQPTSHVAELPATKAKPTVDADQACLAPMTEHNLQPRAKPPESTMLNAMREVANLHAKSALDTHLERFLIRRTLNSAAAGLACLIAAIVAIACAPILGHSMHVGLVVAVVASVYFFWVCFRSTLKYLELVKENETNDRHNARSR